MKPSIRKTVMRASLSLRAAVAVLFFGVVAASYPDDALASMPVSTTAIDGSFASIALGDQDSQPARDGRVVAKPAKYKPAGSSRRKTQTLADVISAPTLIAGDFAKALSGRNIAQANMAVDERNDNGIMIAVERKDHAGKVQRREAIVTVEDVDDVATNDQPAALTGAASKAGISVSLGDDRDVVRVVSTSVGLSVQPQQIALARSGASVEILIDEIAGSRARDSVQIYPRDAALLHWDPVTRTLTATASHARTEIFVARSGQLVVVPVVLGMQGQRVAGTGKNGLALPPELVRLPEVPVNGAAAIARLPAGDDNSAVSSALEETGTSINSSKEEADKAAADVAVREVKLRRAAMKVSRRSLKINLTDERTSTQGAAAFPVPGAQVYVAGAEFSSISDAHGSVNLLDIPAGARLLVSTNDNAGNYVRSAAMVELAAGGGGAIVRNIVVPRSAIFDTWLRMTGAAQDAGLGSLCLDFSGPDVNGIHARIDVKGQGPWYFNRDGVIDHNATSTSGSGRVCWFNIDPGPVNVSAWQSDRQVMATEFPVLAGRHTHERVKLLPELTGIHVQFARETAAHEQLGGNDALARYVVEKEQEAVLVATTQQLFASGSGTQGVGSSVAAAGGSSVVYLDSADLESAIYRVRGSDKGEMINVLPGLPRGFVQDMAVYAQQSQDFTEGAVLVEFAALQGQGSGKIDIHLVNEYGQHVAEPWVFSDMPVTKAIFFNVPPGMYSVIVESASSGWLAAEAVSVYGEATSVVQAGSLLIPEVTPHTQGAR